MGNAVKISNKIIGDGHPVYIVAEIGINHNGDLDIAKRLIDAAVQAGCDAVKFQKRTPELCVPEDQRDIMRDTPWGYMSYMEYRYKVEFGDNEYRKIDKHCRERRITWFASCWDKEAITFMEAFNPPCYKIPSALLTDDALLHHCRRYGRPIILSTGMSTQEEVDHAVAVLGKEDLIILHCTSTYPSKLEELNLKTILSFKRRYKIPIGYSGHEVGLATSLAAATMGACMIERHITLDRAMWGSDQAASVEPHGFARLIKDIRAIEKALGDGSKQVYDTEIPIINKLRKV